MQPTGRSVKASLTTRLADGCDGCDRFTIQMSGLA